MKPLLLMVCIVLFSTSPGPVGRSMAEQNARREAEGPPESGPPAVRVMSFNVRFGTADDGENQWLRRKELVSDVIRQFDPDVLGTQELLPLQAEFLLAQFREYAYLGMSRSASNPSDEQCGIFYRRDRLVPLEGGHIWLSETPEVPGSKSWDSSLPRMVTWLKLFDRRTDRPFYVANTHFDHRGEVARIESARLLRNRLDALQPDVPVIIMGDFNCGEGSQPYQTLLDRPAGQPRRLIDTYRMAHPQPADNEGTYHGFRGARSGPRIDWIVVSADWQVADAQIVAWHNQGRYPSDHYPVVATLKYRQP